MAFLEASVWCEGRQAGFWIFGLEKVVEYVFAQVLLVATLVLNLVFELSSLCNASHNPLVEGFHIIREKSVEQAIKASRSKPDS